jgi:hypothetical protein
VLTTYEIRGPSGAAFDIRSDHQPTAPELKKVFADLAQERVRIAAELTQQRRWHVMGGATLWAVMTAALSLLGWSVGWVRRGFTKSARP